MTKIKMAGYIVANNEAIWGVGDTAAAAWQDFERNMTSENITILQDGADSSGLDGHLIRADDYRIWPASAGLLAAVDHMAGDVRWSSVGSVACLTGETEPVAGTR